MTGKLKTVTAGTLDTSKTAGEIARAGWLSRWSWMVLSGLSPPGTDNSATQVEIPGTEPLRANGMKIQQRMILLSFDFIL